MIVLQQKRRSARPISQREQNFHPMHDDSNRSNGHSCSALSSTTQISAATMMPICTERPKSTPPSTHSGFTFGGSKRKKPRPVASSLNVSGASPSARTTTAARSCSAATVATVKKAVCLSASITTVIRRRSSFGSNFAEIKLTVTFNPRTPRNAATATHTFASAGHSTAPATSTAGQTSQPLMLL